MEIFNRIFNRWTKWEIYKENSLYNEYWSVCGIKIGEEKLVYYDVLKRKNKYTGEIQYKHVKKS